jgi:hypothetical protein
MAASADWSSLPSELISRIADCLLATNDVDYYMDLRAVCGTWRSATADAKNNPDKRFQPSRWVVIDEVNYSLDAKCRTRLLVSTTTGRVLRKDLPMLGRYYVVTTTPGGFFVLANREPPHAACVLNPFTGYLVRFMAPMVTHEVDAAAVYGPAAAPTLMLFCDSSRKLYTATTDSGCFGVYEDDRDNYPHIRLGLLGILCTGDSDVSEKIFDLMLSFAVHPSEMLAVHPSTPGHTNRCFLVESAGECLIVMKLQHGMEVFRMNTEKGVFEPTRSIGNQAIFLGYRQCLSVNADKFPSIEANCIYYLKTLAFSEPCDIYMYDLKDEKEERVSAAINTVNHVFLFDAEPPFTIIQLLSSYTINSWGSELQFQGVPEDIDFSAYLEDTDLSAYLEDLEFDE